MALSQVSGYIFLVKNLKIIIKMHSFIMVTIGCNSKAEQAQEFPLALRNSIWSKTIKVAFSLWSKCIYQVVSKHWMCVHKMLNRGLNQGVFLSLFKLISCPIYWIVCVLAYRTCTIISRGLYIFLPHFQSPFMYCDL